ncbi:kunitz-like toxin PcKuz3 [Musca domestica]|uniref:KappaPI-actitoxin-Avd3c-like isoform X1 n=1 Tax=Musca domestica TaxID=7370 RepID=A0A1I8NE42_MUSDO|nr:kunitz-like toxin PcKuz3 [Musca domestica]
MKVFAFLLTVLLAFFSTSLALKDPICGQPSAVIGICRAEIPKFTYNAASNECISFVYGGCHGNDNNFATKEECEEKCKE